MSFGDFLKDVKDTFKEGVDKTIELGKDVKDSVEKTYDEHASQDVKKAFKKGKETFESAKDSTASLFESIYNKVKDENSSIYNKNENDHNHSHSHKRK